MELLLFDEVGEAVRSLVPADLGSVQCRAHRYGVKLWLIPTKQEAPANPPREHYEAQVIGAKHVADAEVLAIEVGFHAENRKPDENDETLALLLKHEKAWRKTLGDEAVAGPFLGRPEDWRRVSETWPDPDLGDPEIGMELALRLADYVLALEPILRRHAPRGRAVSA